MKFQIYSRTFNKENPWEKLGDVVESEDFETWKKIFPDAKFEILK